MASSPSCHGNPGGAVAPAGAPIIALVGSPNSGKSTLFNALTGAKVQTDNWPGTTVEVSRCSWKLGEATADLIDCPADERPDAVVVVVDASAVARGLNVALQLAEQPYRLIIALTKTDVALNQGQSVGPAAKASVSEVEHATPLSHHLDAVALHPVAGPLLFLAVMWAVFQITTTVAAPLQDGVETLVSGPLSDWARAGLEAIGLSHPLITGLLVDGLIGGVGMSSPSPRSWRYCSCTWRCWRIPARWRVRRWSRIALCGPSVCRARLSSPSQLGLRRMILRGVKRWRRRIRPMARLRTPSLQPLPRLASILGPWRARW